MEIIRKLDESIELVQDCCNLLGAMQEERETFCDGRKSLFMAVRVCFGQQLFPAYRELSRAGRY